jgi:predicted nucleotidyltransferase
LRDAALVVEIDGIEVAIASLDDLIRMKRASARPSDLEDIAALTRLG